MTKQTRSKLKKLKLKKKIKYSHQKRNEGLLSYFSCVQLFVTPPDSSVRGILQARTLKWVAVPSSRGSSQPKDQTHVPYVSCIGRWVQRTTDHQILPKSTNLDVNQNIQSIAFIVSANVSCLHSTATKNTDT